VVLLANKRKLSDIKKKIHNGNANVLTAQEFISRIEKGENFKFEDIDVITTATKGLMSGIMGVFSFRLTPPKTLRKFTEITLNGISAFPGPCPNEYLGIADLIVYGTAQSHSRENYCGGSLFRELHAKSSEGNVIDMDLTLKEMQFAKLMGTRQAIKNYNAMLNCETYQVDTIFSCLPFEPNKSELTFSGCGGLNPFQNDPNFRTFGVGSPLLVNGAHGYLMGPGTRNYIAAFKTSYGLEPICSIAIPIPILTDKIFDDIVKSDRDVKLTILSLVGREKVGEITYADVWDNNFVMKFNPEACSKGYICKVIDNCPTNAFIIRDGLISAIDISKCFNCGNCARLCPDAFSMDLKSIQYEGSEIPVVLRQSDRAGAIMLADELKQQILKEEFQLKKPTGRLDFAEKLK